MSTISKVRGLHAEFASATAYPDATIQSALDEAAMHMHADTWGTSKYDLGAALLAAHLLIDSNPGGDGGAKGTLVEEQMGPARYRYAERRSSGDDVLNLGATTYGRRFMALRDTIVAGPFVAVT